MDFSHINPGQVFIYGSDLTIGTAMVKLIILDKRVMYILVPVLRHWGFFFHIIPESFSNAGSPVNEMEVTIWGRFILPDEKKACLPDIGVLYYYLSPQGAMSGSVRHGQPTFFKKLLTKKDRT